MKKKVLCVLLSLSLSMMPENFTLYAAEWQVSASALAAGTQDLQKEEKTQEDVSALYATENITEDISNSESMKDTTDREFELQNSENSTENESTENKSIENITEQETLEENTESMSELREAAEEVGMQQPAVPSVIEKTDSSDAPTADNIAEGEIGSITWVIDKDGKLTVSGTGEYNTDSGEPPAWLVYADKINTAVIELSEIQNLSGLLSGCINLKTVDLSKLDTSQTVYMDSVFSGCQSLEAIDFKSISKWDTSKVENISNMFADCSSLTSLDVSTFETSKITEMIGVFDGCTALEHLNFGTTGTWNTGAVTDMSAMFNGCNSLADLDIATWDTSAVTSMNNMFCGCERLAELDLSGWNTSNVVNMVEMFSRCCSLTSLNVSGWDTSNVDGMNSMFHYCEKLICLDLSSFDTSKNESMYSMFSGCKSLTEIKVNSSKFVTDHVTNMADMFSECESLTGIDFISKWNTGSVTNMGSMFSGCKNLKSIDVSGFATDNVTDMSFMFNECESLENIDFAKWNTSNVTDMHGMFSSCESIVDLDVGSFNTQNVTDMSMMFLFCKVLNSLNLKTFNTSNVITMEMMFSGCDKLNSIDMSNWNTSKVTDMSNMFSYCKKLNNLDIKAFNTSMVTNMSNMFSHCGMLDNLDVKTFNTSNVITMSLMFSYCENITSLDLSSFDCSNVTEMELILDGCVRLQELKTPKNLKAGLVGIELPSDSANENSWQDESGTEYRNLPTEQSDSVLLRRELTSVPENRYIVSFDLQGHGEEIEAIVVESGKLVTAPENPIAAGYTFDGWYKEKKCINVWNFETDTITEDITLYAKWIENPDKPDITTYTITYDMQGYGAQIEAVTAEEGAKIAEPPAPTAERFTFGGWYKEKECINVWDFEKELVTENITLYAKWTENQPEKPGVTTYTITYDMQGYGVQIESVTVEQGAKITEPPAPTAEGFTFGGWYKEKECINVWDFEKELVSADITLYAKWTENHPEIPDAPEDKDDSPYDQSERIDLNSVSGAIANIKAKNYDGNSYEPVLKVTVIKDGKKKTLVEGADYRVLYKDNVNAGTGIAIVRGNGLYKGEITKTFTIKPKSVKKLKITTGSITLDGQEGVAIPIYAYDGAKLLWAGRDFEQSVNGSLTSFVNKNVKVTINGTGNYTGSAVVKIPVYDTAQSQIIKPQNITLKYTMTQYTGKAIKDNEPTVTIGDKVLVKNKDYKIQYKNNTNVGNALVIVTGKGAYKGKAVKDFMITPPTGVQWSAKTISDKTYNGKLQKPAVTGVKAGNKKLVKNRDFTVTYRNNLHVGTATVILTGKGNYEGQTIYYYFTIKPQKIAKVSVKGTKAVGINVVYNKRTLKEGTDYILEYGEENKNKVKVTLTGKGDFTGSVTKTVKLQ